MKKYAIILAGGEGKRMNTETPKQFFVVCGKPVIVHTIELFLKTITDLTVIVVINPKFKHYWDETVLRFDLLSDCIYAEGGPQRFHSVRNGLALIAEENSLVAIHDAVRPCVSENVIKKAFQVAETFGNAVPAISINESVRIINGPYNEATNRNNLVIVQTPQCFHTSLIKKAYKQNYHEHFTDDAVILESIGYRIRIIEGNPENIKITRPSDFLCAEAFIKQKQF